MIRLDRIIPAGTIDRIAIKMDRRSLKCRYVLYGEWLYAKHPVFYDRLPHYFLEYDLLDREWINLNTQIFKPLLNRFSLSIEELPLADNRR